MRKINQNSILVVPLIIVCAGTFLMYNNSMNDQIRSLKREIRHLEYTLEDVSYKLDTLIESNKIISNVQYKIEQVSAGDAFLGQTQVMFESNQLESTNDIILLYRKVFDFKNDSNYDYSLEEWDQSRVNSNKGDYTAEIQLEYSSNYELKLKYSKEGKVFYEPLADIDLYTKSESQYSRDINIHSLKNNQLKYDVQIAQVGSKQSSELLIAECNIYYDNKSIKNIDILEVNKIEGRKEPKGQLEHEGDHYWFILEDVDFGHIDDFDKNKVLFELVLQDSLKNNYKLTKSVDLY